MKKSLGAKPMVYPAPALVVCTYDDEGRANAMTAAWGGICCSKPPCVTVSLREATYSHGNIVRRKAFTVNVASEDYVVAVDYFGVASGRDEDKIAAAGLTVSRAEQVDAPALAEFPVTLECRLVETHDLGLHTQFIGEILDVKVDESCLDEKDRPAMEKIRPIVYSPRGHGYYGIGELLGEAFSIGKGLRGSE